jgi:hypothetical protein
MVSVKKSFFFVTSCIILLFFAACAGLPHSNGSGGSGGGGGTGPFTLGGTVSGLAGTGLILQNNAENLPINANGAFSFKTLVANGAAYAVTVATPPSSPAQTCTVTNGSGMATANVTGVTVTCTTGTVAIGVTVAGLTGTGLVLQNGTDFLTITGTTTSTQFKNAVPFGQTYNVTVSTQPTTPAQTCTVTNGSGTATAGVAVNVQVTCSLGTLSIGGSVSGYAGGTGFFLQNNGGDNLAITKNGTFTFPTLVPVNGAYKVTVFTQPSGPNQTCTVSLGTGTATANVTNVSVVCPAVFHPIDVNVVGVLGASGSMQLLNNGGDNLMTPKNGSYTFATQIAHGSSYDVTEFVAPGTQFEGCIVWGFSGVALTTPVNPIPLVDCGHDDWTWMAGTNMTDQFGTPSPAPPAPPTPPPPPPACPPVSTFTPGGSSYSATWTDSSGNLWLLTGQGFTSATPPPSNLPGFFNELWEFTGTANYGGSCNNAWTLVRPTGPTPPGRWGAVTWTDQSTGNLWLFGGQDGSLAFLNDLWEYNIASNTWIFHAGGGDEPGVYGTQGLASASNLPGGRWGASAKLDASGNLWLFGGFGCDSTGPGCSNLLLNDLWRFTAGQWTWVSGAITGNQAGSYGTQGTAAAGNVPPGRQASVAWVDKSGNFWMFGGFTSGTNGFNDLWKFDPLAKQWTWESGSKGATNTPGNYGTQGVAAASNVPGARWISAAWSDTHGNLWLFGGQGFDATGNGSLGDLWIYALDTTTDPGNPATIALGQWTWIKGPSSVSQPGVYGLQPSPTVWPHITNSPGTRWGPAYWTTTPAQTGEQMFWMFGGEGFDATGSTGKGFMLLNDLWRYLPFR